MARDVSAQLHHVEGDINMNDKCNILYSAVLILFQIILAIPSNHFALKVLPTVNGKLLMAWALEPPQLQESTTRDVTWCAIGKIAMFFRLVSYIDVFYCMFGILSLIYRYMIYPWLLLVLQRFHRFFMAHVQIHWKPQALGDGGFQYLLAGARANVGIKVWPPSNNWLDQNLG